MERAQETSERGHEWGSGPGGAVTRRPCPVHTPHRLVAHGKDEFTGEMGHHWWRWMSDTIRLPGFLSVKRPKVVAGAGDGLGCL